MSLKAGNKRSYYYVQKEIIIFLFYWEFVLLFYPLALAQLIQKKIHHQVLLQLKLLKVLIPLQWRRSQKIVIKMGH